jgi:hypothetical protein
MELVPVHFYNAPNYNCGAYFCQFLPNITIDKGLQRCPFAATVKCKKQFPYSIAGMQDYKHGRTCRVSNAFMILLRY